MRSFAQFFGPNAGYVLELYEQYKKDPASVDAEFRQLFQENAHLFIDAETTTPTTQPRESVDNVHAIAAARLIRFIREMGHLAAHIDPLGKQPVSDPSLEFAYHDLSNADLRGLPASILRSPLEAECSDALTGVQALRALYSGSLGYEADHIQVYNERKWIHDAIETRKFFYGFCIPPLWVKNASPSKAATS